MPEMNPHHIADRFHLAPGVHAAPVALGDAIPLANLISTNVAHLAAYLPQVGALAHPETAREHLDVALAARAEGSLYEWHIFSEGVLCGAVRVNHVEAAHRKAAIAYYIGGNYQGKGLATLAVRAVLEWAFAQLGMNRIELRCASSNLASQSLAKRLGFTWEGMLRQAELLNGEFVDHFVYGLLKQDFKSTAELEKAACA